MHALTKSARPSDRCHPGVPVVPGLAPAAAYAERFLFPKFSGEQGAGHRDRENTLFKGGPDGKVGQLAGRRRVGS